MIDVFGLKKLYSTDGIVKEIYSEFSLSICTGEVVSIMGKNGTGKSTLLNIISGIDSQYDGDVVKKSNEVSYMFQSDLLVPWKNVIQNSLLHYEINGGVNESQFDNAHNLLCDFGMRDLIDRYPKYLSGGERQKAALARTILRKVPIYLMDEPFSSIDSQSKPILYAIIYSIFKKNQSTVLMVTQDIEEAVFFSDRVLVLTDVPHKNYISVNIDIPFCDHNYIDLKDDKEFRLYYKEIWGFLNKVLR